MPVMVEDPDADRQTLYRIVIGPLDVAHHCRHGVVEPGFPQLAAPGTEIIDQKDGDKAGSRAQSLVGIKAVNGTDAPHDRHDDADGPP